MAQDNQGMDCLPSITLHVDREGRVHAFADAHAQWKLLSPLPIKALIEVYNDLLEEAGEGLTVLDVQVDREGQVHAYTDAHATWRFITPISVTELVETYKEILTNVALESKDNHDPPPRELRGHGHHRRR